MENLTDQEIALLLAMNTKIENGKLIENENALHLAELAAAAETTVDNAKNTLNLLKEKGILRPIKSYDGTVYAYADNDAAQEVYEEIHRQTKNAPYTSAKACH